MPAPSPPPDDEWDQFEMLDLVGSGSPEAKGGGSAAKEGELREAPCGTCHIETCPGVIGECLLNTEPLRALGVAAEDGDGFDRTGRVSMFRFGPPSPSEEPQVRDLRAAKDQMQGAALSVCGRKVKKAA